MNVTFLVYADNAVYQICTPTIKSHCPDKGTTSVTAVPGSAQRFSGHANLPPEAFQVPMRGSWQVTL